jgi:hypothetical protein
MKPPYPHWVRGFLYMVLGCRIHLVTVLPEGWTQHAAPLHVYFWGEMILIIHSMVKNKYFKYSVSGTFKRIG